MWGGKQIAALKLEGAAGAAINLTAATMGYITIPFRCRPLMACLRITTQLSSTGDMTVTLTKTSTGDCGTLTIPNGAAATKTYYEETDYTSAAGTSPAWLGTLAQGDRLTVASAATSGSYSSGSGIVWVLVEVDPERPANNSNMVSA